MAKDKIKLEVEKKNNMREQQVNNDKKGISFFLIFELIKIIIR
jgi:hypothetical protein